MSLIGAQSQKVSQKYEQNKVKPGVRVGPCRVRSFGDSRQNLTTNLGVGGSNPSGRASPDAKSISYCDDRLRHHVSGGFALAVLPRSGLGSDAARALVFRSNRVGPNLAHPARDYRGAAPTRPAGPSSERGRLMTQSFGKSN